MLKMTHELIIKQVLKLRNQSFKSFEIRILKVSFRLFVFCFVLFLFLFVFWIFLINWNAKLEVKFWFSLLYSSWDIKLNDFFIFKTNEHWIYFLFMILIRKTENQIYLSKYLKRLVTILPYAITINISI